MTTRVYAGGGGGGGGSELVGGSCDKQFPHFMSQHQIFVNRGVVVRESLVVTAAAALLFLGAPAVRALCYLLKSPPHPRG